MWAPILGTSASPVSDTCSQASWSPCVPARHRTQVSTRSAAPVSQLANSAHPSTAGRTRANDRFHPRPAARRATASATKDAFRSFVGARRRPRQAPTEEASWIGGRDAPVWCPTLHDETQDRSHDTRATLVRGPLPRPSPHTRRLRRADHALASPGIRRRHRSRRRRGPRLRPRHRNRHVRRTRTGVSPCRQTRPRRRDLLADPRQHPLARRLPDGLLRHRQRTPADLDDQGPPAQRTHPLPDSLGNQGGAPILRGRRQSRRPLSSGERACERPRSTLLSWTTRRSRCSPSSSVCS